MKEECHTLTKAYKITPVPKPRMTQSDKWRRREVVQRYWNFKDQCRELGVTIPDCNYHIVFVMPMPKSWPAWKREQNNGRPHLQTPDKDNLEKSLLDALFDNDCKVWDGRVSKIWGVEGGIIIHYDFRPVDLSFITMEDK